MEFTVKFADGIEAATQYPENSRFTILDDGVLRIDGPDRMTTFYSPGAWLSVSHKSRDGSAILA